MATLVLIGISILLSIIANALLIEIQTNLNMFPDLAFDLPTQLAEVLGGVDIIGPMYKITTAAGLSFLTLITLKKGLDTYAFHTDGDPDSDPIMLVTRFCQAIATIGLFDPILKEINTVIKKLSKSLTDIIKALTGTDWDSAVKGFTNNINEDTISVNFLSILFAIVFGVIFLILYFSVIKNGTEMIILQLGIPFAVAGLINADKGVFKSYIMSVVKVIVTLLVKVVCAQLGFTALMVSLSTGNGSSFGTNVLGVIFGIAFISTALGASKLLAEFMVPSGGGGGMKTFHAAQMATRIFRK